MDTFNPLQLPSANSGGPESAARLIENQFGDGYAQTAPDGLNAITTTLPMSWNACSPSTKTYIDVFLRTHVGQPFYYTVPSESVARKWACKTWKCQPGSGGYFSVTATFTERFDMA